MKRRKLLRHGIVGYVSTGIMRNRKQRYLFLFSDCLLVAVPNKPKQYSISLSSSFQPLPCKHLLVAENKYKKGVQQTCGNEQESEHNNTKNAMGSFKSVEERISAIENTLNNLNGNGTQRLAARMTRAKTMQRLARGTQTSYANTNYVLKMLIPMVGSTAFLPMPECANFSFCILAQVKVKGPFPL